MNSPRMAGASGPNLKCVRETLSFHRQAGKPYEYKQAPGGAQAKPRLAGVNQESESHSGFFPRNPGELCLAL